MIDLEVFLNVVWIMVIMRRRGLEIYDDDLLFDPKGMFQPNVALTYQSPLYLAHAHTSLLGYTSRPPQISRLPCRRPPCRSLDIRSIKYQILLHPLSIVIKSKSGAPCLSDIEIQCSRLIHLRSSAVSGRS